MYRQQLNTHARGVLLNAPRIPDYHLMVGQAEDLESQPLVIYEKAYPDIARGSIVQNMNLSDDEIQKKLENDTLEVNDLMENTLLISGGL